MLTILVLGLMVLCTSQTKFARAQLSSPICITPSGSVNPAWAPILHVGEIYKFTANLYNTPLIVEKNNIIVDGQGFTLRGPGSGVAINLTCINVTVENFCISGWNIGVLGVFDNNMIIGNNFTNNDGNLAIYANDYRVISNNMGEPRMVARIVGNNTIIAKNQIRLVHCAIGFWISSSSGTVFEANEVVTLSNCDYFISTDNGRLRAYHNNFLDVEKNTDGSLLWIFSWPKPADTTSLPWDNGYPSGGNYWSNYNGTDANHDGIGDTNYTVCSYTADRFPLMDPVDISKITIDFPTPAPIATPTPAPTLTPTPTPGEETQQSKPSTVVIGVAIIATVVGAGLGLLIYVVKRK